MNLLATPSLSGHHPSSPLAAVPRMDEPRPWRDEVNARCVHDEPAQPAAGFDLRRTGHGMLNAGKRMRRSSVAVRHILIKLLGKLPGTRFKSRLFKRLFKIQMGSDVGLAGGSYLDPYDPSMITFGDNVILGYEAKIFVHVFTLDRQRVRPVTIGNNVLIGALSVIAPGVTIGDNATIAPGTIVSRDVPAGALAMGNPMVVKRRGASRDQGIEASRVRN